MTPSMQPARAARSSRMGPLPRFLCICSALAALVLLALPAPAAAGTPCWKRVVNDWFDGRIDNTYPIKCYREAMRRLPDDAKQYSNAPDDIRRALLALLRDRRGGGGVTGPGERPPIPTGSAPSAAAAKADDGFFRELLGFLGPKNADSVPIPLVILASLALLLLGAATASHVARWIQARRVQLVPATAPAPAPASGPRPATPPQEQT